MKTIFLALSIFASALSFANDVTEVRQASSVRVQSVQKEIIGTGFPSTKVIVTAQFGNACEAPSADELVSIVNYSRDFSVLNIALGNESQRICPAVFQPVTLTIDVGTFTRPNDGNFSKITVNGVTAR